MNRLEDLQRSVVNAWEADPTLSALTTGIGYNRATDRTYPYGVFYITADAQHTWGSTRDRVRLQFNVFDDATSSGRIHQIAEAADAVFNRVKLTLQDHEFSVSLKRVETEVFLNDSNNWQTTIVFEGVIS